MNNTNYIITIGLNDKYTKRQEIDTAQAITQVFKMLDEQSFNGGTIKQNNGFYRHANGTIVHENSLSIELYDTTLKQVTIFCNSAKVLFNQESIILATQTLKTQFI